MLCTRAAALSQVQQPAGQPPGLLHAVVTVCPVSKLLYFTFGFRFKLIASQAYSL